MSHLRVCARFRPDDHGDEDIACVRAIDSECFIVKDEKKEEFEFTFDRVFYQGSEQADVYDFIALPIVKGTSYM
ncbi:hypothetical protein LIER_38613 [Lithospermum erythrorhizon]|uniref:Kinesin motor domain-containing protein n=1 Tax=Lithospermum erythrorhizon TaxID=34254 RepID=A0AAV3Q540_LITER